MTERHPQPASEEFWRDYLTRGAPMERQVRRIFKRIPHEPRCSLCAAPFAGIGAPVMRLIGKRQSDKSPSMCMTCFTFLARHHGGAEIECTLLFADIRGSTTLAEGMSSTEFRALLDRFYDVAAKVVFDHDGGVDAALTAVGDVVNTAARLASAATAGEILVTLEAATAAGLGPDLERRRLDLKGKQLVTEVVALTISRPA